MAKREQLFWLGSHPVRDDAHLKQLEVKAAVHQFAHGLDRAAAEAKTKSEDINERHYVAAAHHLDGMQIANAVGNHEDAKRHNEFYRLHVMSAGGNPDGAVPPEVQRLRSSTKRRSAYTFRPHTDDHFLVRE